MTSRSEDNRIGSGVYWLLGLPVDAVGLDEAARIIRAAAQSGEELIFATPNLNFLRTAAEDSTFRETTLTTGLSLADGMPLIWISRLLGIPIRERVAGSTLFDHLRANSCGADPLKVFFFGGDPGVAELAMKRINEHPGGLQAAGALSPGFGSIAEMSAPKTIRAINDSDANFLVVALGAQKGHAWIEFNRGRLRPMVISHLGAVINFAAGSVARAPRILQVSGLEWLWRLAQEPRLFSRYAKDALYLLRELFTAAFPIWIQRLRSQDSKELQVETRETPSGAWEMRLKGSLNAQTVGSVLDELANAEFRNLPIGSLNLDDVWAIDPRGIGALYQLRYRRHTPVRIVLNPNNSDLMRELKRHRATCLLGP